MRIPLLTLAGIGGLSLLKSNPLGGANMNLTAWESWTNDDFVRNCNQFVNSYGPYAYNWQLGLMTQGRDATLELLTTLYNVGRYAFMHKILSGDAKKMCLRITNYRSWGTTNLERLQNSFGNLSYIVRNLAVAQDKSSDSSVSHTYSIGRFNIDNSSGISGRKKDQLDGVLKKLIEIGENCSIPDFSQVLEGNIRYMPDMGDRLGTYNLRTEEVTLRTYSRKSIPDSAYIEILIHEFAHKYEMKKLSKDQKLKLDELKVKTDKARRQMIIQSTVPGAPLGFAFTNTQEKGELVFHGIKDGHVIVKYPSEPDNLINTGYKIRAFNNRLNKWCRGILPNGYANTNRQEMFAEISVAYILKPEFGYILDDFVKSEFEKILGIQTDGSINRNEIAVLRVEKRKGRLGGNDHMRALSRGRMFNPNQVIGAIVTLVGPNPQELKTYMSVEPILRQEQRRLGLFGKMFSFMNVYQSRSKPGMWEAKWEIR